MVTEFGLGLQVVFVLLLEHSVPVMLLWWGGGKQLLPMHVRRWLGTFASKTVAWNTPIQKAASEHSHLEHWLGTSTFRTGPEHSNLEHWTRTLTCIALAWSTRMQNTDLEYS